MMQWPPKANKRSSSVQVPSRLDDDGGECLEVSAIVVERLEVSEVRLIPLLSFMFPVSFLPSFVAVCGWKSCIGVIGRVDVNAEEVHDSIQEQEDHVVVVMAMVQHDASAIEQVDVLRLLNTRSSPVRHGDVDIHVMSSL
jgi:ribosomal protein L18E